MNTTNESTSSVDGWPLNDASPALANDAVTQKQNPKLQQDQTKNCNEKLDLLQELRKSISDKQDECEHNQSLTSCDTPSPSAESPEIPAEPVPVPSTDEATSSSSPKPQAALDSFALQQTELQQVQLARLEAARRRRENHDRQQELNGASNAAAGQPPAKKPIIDASKPVNQVQEKPTAPANQLSDAPPTPPVQQAPVQQAPVEQQVPEQQAPKSTPTTAEHPTPQNAVPMVQHVAPNNTNAGFIQYRHSLAIRNKPRSTLQINTRITIPSISSSQCRRAKCRPIRWLNKGILRYLTDTKWFMVNLCGKNCKTTLQPKM